MSDLSSVSDHSNHRAHAAELLSVHLWDLRAQAEAKLRCLTRLQQELNEFNARRSESEHADKVQRIAKDLTDIVTISKSLHDVASRALHEAMRLS